MSRALCLLLWLSLSSVALGGPDITLLSGERTEKEIKQALAQRGPWFDRAIKNCNTQSKSGCDIVLELQLAPQTASPICAISSSTIKPKEIAAIYCKVAETLSFSPTSSNSAFTLSFGRNTVIGDSAYPPAGAPISTLPAQTNDQNATKIGCTDRSATQARDVESVLRCFESQNGALSYIYQKALSRDPTLQGTLRLKLTIEADGQVSNVSLNRNSITSPVDFSGEILEAVKGFRFGPASSGWQGSHDLNFFPD